MEERVCALSELAEGQQATVLDMDLSGAIRRRVRELGLLPRSEVACLRIAPAGSPAAYSICGAVVALRRRDAEKVLVRLCL